MEEGLRKIAHAVDLKYADSSNRNPAWFGYQVSPNVCQSRSSYTVSPISYDNSGNITGLQRYGIRTSVVDNLGYHYVSGTDRVDY